MPKAEEQTLSKLTVLRPTGRALLASSAFTSTMVNSAAPYSSRIIAFAWPSLKMRPCSLSAVTRGALLLLLLSATKCTRSVW
jgi:hypothetical protein